MELSGVTQAQMSEICGTSPSQLGLFLKGKASLNRESLDKCLEAVGLDMTILVKRFETAAQTAEMLADYSNEAIAMMSREEMAEATGIEIIKLLPDASAEEYEKMISSGIVDIESTYPFFKVLVMHLKNGGSKFTASSVKDSLNSIMGVAAVGAVAGAAALFGVAGMLLSPLAMAVQGLAKKHIFKSTSINSWTPLVTLGYEILKRKK